MIDQFRDSQFAGKGKIIDRIYLIAFILVIPALIASIIRYPYTGFKVLYVFQVALEFTVILIYIFRDRISTALKTTVFIVIIAMVSISGLYEFGYLGEAKSFLILIPVFIALFVNKRLAYYSIVFCALVFVITGYIHVMGYKPVSLDLDGYFNSPSKWVAMSFTFITIMALLIYIITTTLESQSQAINSSNQKDLQIASIANALPGVIFQFKVISGEKWQFTYVSPKAQTIFGVSSDLNEPHWHDLNMIYSADKIRLLNVFQEAIHNKSDLIFEGRVAYPENKWFKCIASPVDMDNELVYNGVFLDSTSEKLSAEESEKERRFNQKLINNLPGIYYLFKIDGEKYRLKKWNDRILKLGYSEGELLDMTPYQFFPKSELDKVEFQISQMLKYGYTEFESILKKKSGETVPYYINGHIFHQKEDKYFFGLGINIQELKETQQELDKHRSHLKQLVVERTEDLQNTNEELLRANKYLEKTLSQLKETQDRLVQTEKLASIGTFVAGIAHEINNPLNFIAGAQNILKLSLEDFIEHEGTEEYEDLTVAHEMITDGMARVSNIVKALMTFSFSGQSVLNDVDINKVLDNSLLFLKTKIEKDIEIKKDYQLAEEVPVFEEKLHQIFLNVLDNAIFETSKLQNGNKHISITSTTDTEDDKQYALIKIFNTGCTIPEENISKIFDPFYTTKQPGEGAGLGLSITYSLVQEHQGTIAVANKESGVEFELKFPFQN